MKTRRRFLVIASALAVLIMLVTATPPRAAAGREEELPDVRGVIATDPDVLKLTGPVSQITDIRASIYTGRSKFLIHSVKHNFITYEVVGEKGRAEVDVKSDYERGKWSRKLTVRKPSGPPRPRHPPVTRVASSGKWINKDGTNPDHMPILKTDPAVLSITGPIKDAYYVSIRQINDGTQKSDLVEDYTMRLIGEKGDAEAQIRQVYSGRKWHSITVRATPVQPEAASQPSSQPALEPAASQPVESSNTNTLK